MRELAIRPMVVADLEAVNAIYNHYVATSHVTFDEQPMSLDRRRIWFEQHDDDHPVLAATRDHVLAGFASAGRFRPRDGYAPTVETSVYVAPDATGGGVGTALLRDLLASLDGRGLHRAVAGIALPNDASVALHGRAGYRRIGCFTEVGRKFDRFWDVAWYERPLG